MATSSTSTSPPSADASPFHPDGGGGCADGGAEAPAVAVNDAWSCALDAQPIRVQM